MQRRAPVEEVVGGLAVSASAFSFGGAVVLGKIGFDRDLPIPSMLAFRFAVAGGVVALALLALRRSLRAAPGEGLALFLLGGMGYGLEAGFFYLALDNGTAAAVSLLFFTYPVWVTAISALLGRGAPGALVLGSLVAAIGGAALVVISSGGLDINGFGIAMALLASVTFAAYLLAVDHRLNHTGSLVASMWVTAGAAVVLGLFALITGIGSVPTGYTEWWPVIGMGLFTATAFLGLFIGLRRLGAVRASIIASLEPVATALLALWILGEPVRALTGVGGAFIVVAAGVAALARGRDAPEPTVP